MGVRLQRLLASRGVASRRRSEDLIRQGRVTVNGEPAHLGQVVSDDDVVLVDGRPLPPPADDIYLMLHKPPGYVVTKHDPGGRPTVMALIPARLRRNVFPVGRLDLASEGLLLLTNNGELANQLLHPSHGVVKTYLVWYGGRLQEPALATARAGLEIEPGVTATPSAMRLIRRWPRGGLLEVQLAEGKKREVRRICEAIGLKVMRLKRVAFGPLRLGDLPAGQSRRLTPAEIRELRRAGERR